MNNSSNQQPDFGWLNDGPDGPFLGSTGPEPRPDSYIVVTRQPDGESGVKMELFADKPGTNHYARKLGGFTVHTKAEGFSEVVKDILAAESPEMALETLRSENRAYIHSIDEYFS